MQKRFGNYEILRKIATGGMAEVFLAKHTGIGGFERLVCIKRILPHLGEQEDFIKMFQDEARIAANLVHPSIAQIYDIGEADGSYYIAMEYVRGEDLRRIYNQEVARGRAMPKEQASQIVMGAASALDYAHRQTSIDGRPLGIVHRDISPQNILVSYDGHVKLVDFGVAKAAGKMAQTRSGVLKGKYSYMSPEQASGDPIDGRTDIFALGITLYEITTGARLFKRDNELETLHAVIECKITRPTEVVPGYDPQLEGIVMKALAQDPDARYATAGELERGIEKFLRDCNYLTGPSSLADYMQDLFAEKLADEVLFGGQPWEEANTRSPMTKQERKTGPSMSKGRRKRARVDSATQAATEAAPVAAPVAADETQVETQLQDAPRLTSRSQAPRPKTSHNNWDATDPSASLTATQGVSVDTSTAPPALAMRAAISQPSQVVVQTIPPRAVWPLIAAASAVVVLLGVVIGLILGGGGSSRSGVVRIDSEPQGAQVQFVGERAEEINRMYEGYRTPFMLIDGLPVDAEMHVRFLKEDFETVEVPVPALEPGEPSRVFAELKQSPTAIKHGELMLMTDPSGAEIFINGNKIDGTTPAYNIQVRAGEIHRVQFLLPGYETTERPVRVEPGSRTFVDVDLKPKEQPPPPPADTTTTAQGATPSLSSEKGRLTVQASLPLKVFVDGKYVGSTPLKEVSLAPGPHKLRMTNDTEGVTVRRKVDVDPGETSNLRIDLGKGSLSVNAKPWAYVTLGRDRKDTPARFDGVYEGDYTVTFECPNKETFEKQVKVSADQTESLSVDCSR